MQYLNNDMDDLFRKAAEQYPLNTDSADWEKVKTVIGSPQKSHAEGQKFKLLLLLLLIPLGWMVYELLGNRPVADGDMPAGTHITATDNIDRANPAGEGARSGAVSGQQSVSDARESQNITVPATPDVSSSMITPGTGIHRAQSVSGVSVGKRVQGSGDQDQISSQDQVSSVDNRNAFRLFRRTDPVPYSMNRNRMAAALQISPGRLNIVEAGNEAPENNPRRKKWYAGITGHVDGTSVRMQRLAQAGHGYGVVAGYSISPKWSIEAGFIVDRKYYYSEGKYFNSSKLGLASYYELNEVSGFCDMYEIPVSARYTWHRGRNHSWFASAGVSSYLMNREEYEYLVTNTFLNIQYPYYKSYPSDSRSFLSVAQLTAGFSRSVGGIADVRLEPYLKMPLRKVGVGDISMWSTGVQISVTRPFF